MKKTYLLFYIFIAVLSTVNVNAQANVQSTGISIQGIARDENNSALANIDQLGLQFKIFYLNASNTEVDILNQSANVKTDNFGVFSYVMTIDKSLFTAISNSQAYLKVTQGSTVFSNEKLQAVPYAIQAQNGVPSGTIMAYIGATAPEGWLLCNGAVFNDNPYNAQLKSLLGSTTTPNLNGMFLRGTGTAGTGQSGPALKSVQQDEIKSHLHGINLTTNEWGQHAHTTAFANDDYNGVGGGSTGLEDDTSQAANRTLATNATGEHSHTVVGNTATNGATETRPINYGVNYIIKI